MRDVGTEKRNEFFAKRFNELYLEKWKKVKKTQAEFAEAIQNLYPEKEILCTDKYVSNWLRGVSYPEQYLPLIAKVLGVPESEFAPQTREDRYSNDPEYQERIKSAQETYAEEIGLDMDFLKSVRKITEFEREFPIYNKLIPEMVKFNLSYRRSGNADAAPMINGAELFQISVDNKTITLCGADLKFLADVQERTAEFIQFMFFQRRQEMQREQQRANEIAVTTDNEGITTTRLLSDEQLEEIEHYRKYIYAIDTQEE